MPHSRRIFCAFYAALLEPIFEPVKCGLIVFAVNPIFHAIRHDVIDLGVRTAALLAQEFFVNLVTTPLVLDGQCEPQETVQPVL